jgi:hypothetical protein
MFVNIPGAVHDSQVANYWDVYEKLKAVFVGNGGKYTVDSMFGNLSRDFLIKILQESFHIEDHRKQEIACDVPSMQQSAELEMRAFQSPMPCLKDHIKFETRVELRVVLTMMILLYNLCAWAVGINQLLSFYSAPALYCDASIEFLILLLHN